MKSVHHYSFEPTYTRDNGVMVIDTASLPIPDGFAARETSVVRIPAGEIAGNHTHPRQEAYMCLDAGVELHWLDESGAPHVYNMASTPKPQLFVVPPFVPHAVINQSNSDATLLGYADGPLQDVKPVTVVQKTKEHHNNLAVQALAALQPGLLPFDIFHQIARLTVTPIVEIVPLRYAQAGSVEILLLRRPMDDPIWPGQLHTPGTVVRASDKPGSFDDPLNRIISAELADAKTTSPTFVTNILHHSGRGMEAAQIFWTEIKGNTTVGEWHDANNLPKTLIASQLDFIPMAISHFKDSHR